MSKKRKAEDGTADVKGKIDDFYGDLAVLPTDSADIQNIVNKKEFDIPAFLESLSVENLEALKTATLTYKSNGVADVFIRSVAQFLDDVKTIKNNIKQFV